MNTNTAKTATVPETLISHFWGDMHGARQCWPRGKAVLTVSGATVIAERYVPVLLNGQRAVAVYGYVYPAA